MTHFPDGYFSGRLLRVQALTAGTSYSKLATCKTIIVELIGGGGAGGGPLTAASSACCCGGGGAGGYAMKTFDVSSQAGPFTYAIGQGGTGSSGATGGNGTNSTFTVNAVTVTAKGGLGALGAVAAGTTPQHIPGGAGQLATGGDVNGAGMPGFQGMVFSGTTGTSGSGGDTIYGSGGLGRSSAGVGNAASGFGGGGGGGSVLNGSAQVAGGNGTNGLIIVREYS